VSRLRSAFFLLLVRPLLMLILGAQVHHRERLPLNGPAMIAANHNSHLDTLILLTLFPIRQLRLLRPVAAADYFLRGKFRTWFALCIIGIIPVVRGGHGRNPLADCEAALDRGEILILFPEGSRGTPEVLSQFKRGIAHLAHSHPAVPVHPIFLYGLGKALPKDEFLLVPFNCQIAIGEALFWQEDMDGFMTSLRDRMAALSAEIAKPLWS
jgi:1-acyl-sn-glycerol-3-phosphate acyltransferase